MIPPSNPGAFQSDNIFTLSSKGDPGFDFEFRHRFEMIWGYEKWTLTSLKICLGPPRAPQKLQRPPRCLEKEIVAPLGTHSGMILGPMLEFILESILGAQDVTKSVQNHGWGRK